MKVRNAVARTVATRMAAEGDRLPLRIAAIGIAAITVLKVEEGKVARHDGDAAQIQGRGARQNLHQPPGGLKKTRALLEQPPKAWWPGLFRSSGTIGLACAGDPHALGATDRGITAVGSVPNRSSPSEDIHAAPASAAPPSLIAFDVPKHPMVVSRYFGYSEMKSQA